MNNATEPARIRLTLSLLVMLMTTVAVPAAQGAIATGSGHVTPDDGNSASSGELFLNVWDETAAKSYSLDLGLTVEQLLADPATGRTWNLDQRFKDFAASGNPLSFNIAANNFYGTITAPAIGIVPSSWGVLTSVRNDPAEIASFLLWNGKAAGSVINAASSQILQRLNYLNLSSAEANGLTPGHIPDMRRFDLNLSETTDAISDNWGSYFDHLWGVSSGRKFGVNFTAAVLRQAGTPDQTVVLYFMGLTAPSVNKLKVTDIGGGSLVASLDATNGTLTWGSGGGGSPASCALPWGGAIANGQAVTAYLTDSSADCAAVAETRTCTDGVLSGSHAFQSCTAQTPTGCALPWGGTIADGQSVTAYQTDVSPDCASVAETRSCSNGTLSGSHVHQSCSVPTTPIADAGADTDANIGDRVRLDGSASYDPATPPRPLSFKWKALSFPDGAKFALAGAKTKTPRFVPPIPGDYRFELVVSNRHGASQASSVTIHVAPTLSVTAPSAGEVWTLGSPWTINWTATGISPGKKLLIYLQKPDGDVSRKVLLGRGSKAELGAYTVTLKNTRKNRQALVTDQASVSICLPKIGRNPPFCGSSSGSIIVQ